MSDAVPPPSPSSDPARVARAERDALAGRVAALEGDVAALRAEVARLAARPPARPVRRAWTLPAFDAEAIVGRVGIAVLLVGLAFLLRWGAEQGWLTPAMRVGAVALLGAGLLATGVRLRARQAFGAVLAGGGLAALYGALFAAFQLYGLVGVGTGLALAALLTAGAFALALRARAPVLAVVGSLGAVGAPALMYRDASGLAPTLAFLSLAIAGGGALWGRTGWRTLLVALTLGGWTALTVVRLKARGLPGSDPHAVALAALVALIATTVAALLRAPRPDGEETLPRLASLAQPRAVALWIGPLAFAGLVVSAFRWSGMAEAAVMALTGAAAYVAGRSRPRAAEALTLAAGALVAWAAWHATSHAPLAVGAALAAAALTGLDARRRGDATLPTVATAAIALLGLVLVVLPSLYHGPRTTALGGLAIALAGLGAALWWTPAMGRRTRRVHLLAGHVLVLALAHVALSALPAGRALVAGAWGLYAAALLVAGLRTGRSDVRWLGLTTLVATLGRLLAFDLAGVSMAARVLLFVGLGIVLLAVAYLAPRLGRRTTDDGRQTTGPERTSG